MGSESISQNTLSQMFNANVGIPLSKYNCRNTFVGIAFLGITRDSYGFLWITRDYYGFLGITWDS